MKVPMILSCISANFEYPSVLRLRLFKRLRNVRFSSASSLTSTTTTSRDLSPDLTLSRQQPRIQQHSQAQPMALKAQLSIFTKLRLLKKQTSNFYFPHIAKTPLDRNVRGGLCIYKCIICTKKRTESLRPFYISYCLR